ncbi:glycosyltransferase 61 family protein [Palleronia caenipelagi]|uniref:Glycosyltransferase family 61 protein n=1 Tax=Palleronia caenipelagi TaxID=2489174 RepID=A0A547Q8W8_9RHOB|nr:glycosyltransferase family 61 protein [Palleronia caenipelagi]TRD22836.1 glycosyltransferase family 61 protein [Palleronia caenipelagi]
MAETSEQKIRAREIFPEPQIHEAENVRMVFGPKAGRRKLTFGLYDAVGTPLPYAQINTTLVTTIPSQDPPSVQPPEVIETPVLFAGLAENQFGHVLTNALGRLWALEHLPPETEILFMARPLDWNTRFPFVEPILRFFGITNPVRIVSGDVTLRKVYTATETYGERYNGRGSDAFFDWLEPRINRGDLIPGSKAYVSRSKLGADMGRYACEDIVEENLAAAGYEIFHPQDHSLAEQVEKLSRTEKLIFSESSALHLYYLAAHPGQHAATILRRRALPKLILGQIRNSRAEEPITEINAIKHVLYPPRTEDNSSVATLDFDQLHDQLVRGGFLEDGATWRSPTEEEEAFSVRAGLRPNETMLSLKEWRAYLADLQDQRKERQARRELRQKRKAQREKNALRKRRKAMRERQATAAAQRQAPPQGDS